jgi:hypothetical protein
MGSPSFSIRAAHAAPMAPLTAAAVLIIAIAAGCALPARTESPSPSGVSSSGPSAGNSAAPSGGAGPTYDGRLLGFTIADVEALAAHRGLECTHDAPVGHDVYYFCTTSTPEFDTPDWFMVVGHLWDDEAYNLSIITSTAPPDEEGSRDAVADIAETLMPWIADLGWYRRGDAECRAGRQGDREYDNFGPEYSICGTSSADPGGDGTRSGAELDIANEPEIGTQR